MIVRGLLTYFGLLILLRVVLKRQFGQLASSDLLVTLLIADAIQNAMAGQYQSVPDGLLLVTTIVICDYLIDWTSFHFAWFRKLLHPAPLPLVVDGKIQRRNMRRELVNDEELWSKLRENGVSHLSEVKKAYLESDGEISVTKKKG